jgi:hypothetical protein
MPQGVRIGTTPLSYPMDAIEGQVVLIVKKRGYSDKELAVAANQDSDQTVTLARVASGPKPPRPPPGTGSATAPTGSLDPFEKLKKGN